MSKNNLVVLLLGLFSLFTATTGALIYLVQIGAVTPFTDAMGLNVWWYLTHYAILATGGGAFACAVAVVEINRGTEPFSDDFYEVVACGLIFYVCVFFLSSVGEFSTASFF